jgi:hypothetical protein
MTPSIRRGLLVLCAVPLLSAWVQLRAGDSPSDPPLRFTSGAVVRYHVHSAGYSDLPIARVRAAVDRAFTTWERPCSTLRFEPEANGVDADTPEMDGHNVIRFEERRLPREIDPDTTLAYTSHVGVYCTGIIAEADITFNAVTFAWSDRDDSDRADIETVALHEIGHLLGLDHSPLEDAVMYPSIIERVRRTLSRDETDAICAMYPANRGGVCGRDADCGGGEVCILGVNSDGTVAPRCGPTLGRGRAGQACDAEAGVCENGCRNGLCLNDDLCSNVCSGDGDCPGGWTCLPQAGVDGGPGYGLCVNVRTCEDDVDACPAGEVCVPTRHPVENRTFRICVEATGGRGVGDACDDAEQCVGALCLGGRCSQACDGDGDCGSYPCEPTRISGLPGDVAVCAVAEAACGRAADCAGDLTCTFVVEGDITRSICAPTEGGPAGTACRGAADCRAGYCLEAGVCTDVCRDDRDCPADMECGRVRVGRTSQLACVPVAADMGVAPDASAGPERDATVARPDAGPARDDATLPLADAGFALSEDAGGGGRIDADASVPDGVVVKRGGEDGGCNAAGSAGGGWLFALPFLVRRRRRR